MSEAIQEDESEVKYTPRSDAKKRMEKIKNEELHNVRGKFIFHECPGGSVRICQKKYKDVPMFDRVLTDGKEYDVPLWVARYLNGYDKLAGAVNGLINSCGYPVNEWAQDQQGAKRIDVGQWKRRMSFQSMDFVS